VAAARQRLIERVFGRARAGFADAIRSDAYAAALPHQLEEAFGYLGDRSATVRCPQALETAVRSLIGARRAVTVKADDETAPGIVVQTDDGSLTIDVTLEGRLGAMGAVLALDIVAAAQLPKS